MFSKGKADSGDTAAPAAKRQSDVPSIISPDLTVTGNLVSSGDIQVDGRVDGDVDAANLTVGQHGTIEGTIRATSVHICGTISGEVHAQSVTLAATAHIQGNIVHESLAIEAGAYLDGHCRRRDAMGHTAPAGEQSAAAPQRTNAASDASPWDAKGAAAVNGGGTGRSATGGRGGTNAPAPSRTPDNASATGAAPSGAREDTVSLAESTPASGTGGQASGGGRQSTRKRGS